MVELFVSFYFFLFILSSSLSYLVDSIRCQIVNPFVFPSHSNGFGKS